MTEREWLESTNSIRMLDEVRAYRSDRKLRLFSCVIGRLITSSPPGWGWMLDAAEAWAESGKRPPTLFGCGLFFATDDAYRGAHHAAGLDCGQIFKRLAQGPKRPAASLLRCIMGNPYRHLDVWRWQHKPGLGPLHNPSVDWVTPEVLNLAEAAYGERHLNGTLDNVRLCILADSLEEQGCTEEDILSHLRDGRIHCRGDWVVDLVLGKE